MSVSTRTGEATSKARYSSFLPTARRRERTLRAIFGAVFSAAALSAFAVDPACAAAADDSAAPQVLTSDIAQIAGPRRSIEVGAITASGPITAPNDNWDVAGGLATMLTTALTESGRFVVVERASLPALQPENALATSQATRGAIAPQRPAHVVAAQYFVTGMVTEYGANDSGSGIGVGGGNLLGSALSLSRTNGKVAIDLRVVSTQTAVVVGAFSVSKDISSTSVGITGGYKGIPFGANQFWNTPIGEATRDVLTEATNKIAAIVAGGRWEAQVADIDGNQIIVNAGRIAGLKVGDQLVIERIEKTITDPATAEVLGVVKQKVGKVALTDVQEKYATGTYSALLQTPPQRGDIVTIAN